MPLRAQGALRGLPEPQQSMRIKHAMRFALRSPDKPAACFPDSGSVHHGSTPRDNRGKRRESPRDLNVLECDAVVCCIGLIRSIRSNHSFGSTARMPSAVHRRGRSDGHDRYAHTPCTSLARLPGQTFLLPNRRRRPTLLRSRTPRPRSPVAVQAIAVQQPALASQVAKSHQHEDD